MAVYKIFPKKDITLYSEYPNVNAGLDEILELGYYTSLTDGSTKEMRILIEFDRTDLQQVYNLVGDSSFSAFLKLKAANFPNIPESFLVRIYNVASSWVNGTGKISDTPPRVNGASWTYRGANKSLPWLTDNYPSGVTGSFDEGSEGGGEWYTAIQDVFGFELNSLVDIVANVTELVDQHIQNPITNNGHILIVDRNPNVSEVRMQFFSRQTNTIYPPELEIRWNDFVYETSLQQINTSLASITVSNAKKSYRETEKYRFRLNVRPQFPTRAFSTTSIYLTNNALAPTSTWSIQDYYTKETIVEFDDLYTRVSCDNTGSFFDVYMNGLQAERYYQILIKTEIDGSTLIVPTDAIFKIQRDV